MKYVYALITFIAMLVVEWVLCAIIPHVYAHQSSSAFELTLFLGLVVIALPPLTLFYFIPRVLEAK